MSIEIVKEKVNAAKEKIKALQDELAKECQSAFSEQCKELFARHPKLESFSWRQYTPYFNDGEECTFSAHTGDLDFVFDGTEHECVGNWLLKEYAKDYPAEAIPAFTEALEIIALFDEDTLKSTFGDHVKVVVTPNGAEAEQYDHE